MGRKCTICTHEKSREISSHLLKQTMTLAEIADTYRVSVSAAHRHRQHVKGASITAIMADLNNEELSSGTLSHRLANLMVDCGILRRAAMDAGHASNAMRSIQTERDLIQTAIDAFGYSDATTLRDLREVDDLLRSVAAAALTSDEAHKALSQQMRRRGASSVADALDGLVERANKSKEIPDE